MLFQSKRGNHLLLGGSQLPAKLVHQNHQGKRDGGDSGTRWSIHILFLYRDSRPLCFLTRKAGGGQRRRREKEGEGVAEPDPQVSQVPHGPGR